MRAEGESACEQPLDDRQLASYLMYPKQAIAYHAHVRTYSDTSVVPTPAFLYGLQPQEEVAIDIAAGKTLLISLQGSHPDAEAGNIKVQFELNGQSRTAVVEQRTTTQAGPRVRAAPLPTPTIRCISLRRCRARS